METATKIFSVSAALLAGGASRRMGQDKATLAFAGDTLGGHAAGVLLSLFDDVTVVERADAKRDSWPTHLHRVYDPSDAPQSALTGIISALRNAQQPWVFVMACDMPTPCPKLIDGLCATALAGDPAVRLWVPSVDGVVHPLHAVYHRDLLPLLEQRLSDGNLRLQPFARKYGQAVTEETLQRWNPTLDGLDNLNTPEALAAARQRLQRDNASHFKDS